MNTISLTSSGSHVLEIKEEYLVTIKRYNLFDGLVDSGGYVTEDVLDKLKFNIRSLIASQSGCKDLLDLCLDIIYHKKMKAYGLGQLIVLYTKWIQTYKEENIQETEE